MLVAETRGGATTSELARALEMPVPTTYHLLETLVLEGLLAKSEKRFVLGPGVASLSDAYSSMSPPDYLVEPLVKLAESSEETAYLSAWRNGEAVVLMTVDGRHAVRVASLRAGFHGFAHARAAGKVLLAFGRDDNRERFLASNELAERTPTTITSKKELEAELARVRERGHAFDREEFSLGAIGVAAPVIEGEFAIAAYALTAPAERFRESEDVYVDAVLTAAGSVNVRGKKAGSPTA
jgi:DNA-binding IclR family transcriptional regulator